MGSGGIKGERGKGERGVAGRWSWGCGGCERRVAGGSRAPERR